MLKNMRGRTIAGLLIAHLVALTSVMLSAAAGETERVWFNRDIRPILADHCFACHGPDQKQREAELRLDTQLGLLGDAAEHGPVVPGDADSSELMRRVTAEEVSERMPPAEFGKDLTQEQIELLRRWIAQGAEWQGHWAFQPIRPPAPPDMFRTPIESDLTLPANPIDAFVHAELDELGLRMSPAADRRTLARRLHLDLLGLPPSPDVVERFVNSQDPDAYESLVDELLASPHFGERLAMWWLDLVRYADSVGYHGDQPVSVSPYRDYVIDAFNSDMPFDQFTIEQLAGDLLPEPTRQQQIAAGYNRLGMMSAEGGVQPKEYLAKYIAERVRNLSGTWLGVTFGCCECHDHKYDPFTTRDFYQFEAFFADIEERGLYSGDNWGPKLQIPSQAQQERLAELDAEIAALKPPTPSPAADSTATPPVDEALKLLETERAELEKSIPTMLVVHRVEPRPVRILARGNWMDDSGPIVRPAIPGLLGGSDVDESTTGEAPRLNRLDLARWVVANENPLTARAIVNRLWSLFYGAGLAAKLDDLGAQGESPSHPELLDWLADDFRSSGWKVKRLIKRMVMTYTYCQSSQAEAELLARDPYNRLLARQGRWRLAAEEVRDTLLSCSGLLVERMGGQSVKPYQPAGYWAYLNFPQREWADGQGAELYRRGLYTHWQRQYLHPSLLAFDAPSREECTADRARSNTPLQALVLLNDPTYVEAARALAARILAAADDDHARIEWAIREVVTRPPRQDEVAILAELLEKPRQAYSAQPETAEQLLDVGAWKVTADVPPVELAAWTSVARTLLNLHEAITRN